VLLMNIVVSSEPFVNDENRIEITHLPHNFHVVKLHYGFFEEPKITRVLAQLRIQEFRFKLADVSFFIGNESVTSNSGSWMERLGDSVFIVLHRNMMRAVDYFQIPPGHTIELGGHIEL
jgi:KUP system potassium uptake protein